MTTKQRTTRTTTTTKEKEKQNQPTGWRGKNYNSFNTSTALLIIIVLLSSIIALKDPIFKSLINNYPFSSIMTATTDNNIAGTAAGHPSTNADTSSSSSCSFPPTVQCSHKMGLSPEVEAQIRARETLPTNVKPYHYDLTISPNMKEFIFDGIVKVSLEVNEASPRSIVLNAKELAILGGRLFSSATATAAPIYHFDLSKISFDSEKETVSFVLGDDFRPLVVGEKLQLEVSYSGIINDKMAGFYRSSYKINSEDHWLGATQFESTDARQALPCWDEPALKATFSLTIQNLPPGWTALSNMDVKHQSVVVGAGAGGEDSTTGTTEVSFNPTPLMSTYLLAWVIGDLESIEKTNKNGVICRVYSTRGTIGQGGFALDVAARTLDFFTEYFDIPYPLPKMDMVAIPDFSAGAMENWGLVTYRTAYLLFDPENSSIKTKQQVAYVVGHELAHQWFGNLVTMEWWSDLWLNEGFATWVGWLATDHLFPEWDIWTEFVVDDCQAGLRLDGLRSSHPIEVPVNCPAEISQIFDSISYSKGASLIRQLVTFLGEEPFKAGLRAYLKKHQYSNARTMDLWEALQQSSGKKVAEIMAPWTLHMGYPLVQVEEQRSVNDQGTTTTFTFRQNRFLNAGNVTEEEDRIRWSIPLRVSSSVTGDGDVEDTLKSLVLEKDHLTHTLNAQPSWLKVNAGQAGFFRVLYTEELLKKLGQHLDRLSSSDKVGLISDAFAMTVAGHQKLPAILDILSSFKEETDYLVWGEICSQLHLMMSVWWEEPQDVQEALKAYVKDLVHPMATKLGWEPVAGEGDKLQLLRGLLLNISCQVGDPEVIAEASKRWKAYVGGERKAIHPNLRGAIFSSIMREGGMQEFEQLLSLYKNATITDEKLTALGALGASRKEDVIKRALAMSLGDEGSNVRSQDIIYLTRTCGSNHIGRRMTWEHVKTNWSIYYKRFGLGGGISLLGRVVSTGCQEFSQLKDAEDVEAFFKQHECHTIDRTIQQSLERIKMHSRWLSSNRDVVALFLKKIRR